MKRKIPAVFLLLLTVVFSAVCLFSCKEKDAKPVVITVEEPVATGTTLVEYMDLQGIDYKISNGMVTELDGTKNSTKSFWMLYFTIGRLARLHLADIRSRYGVKIIIISVSELSYILPG